MQMKRFTIHFIVTLVISSIALFGCGHSRAGPSETKTQTDAPNFKSGTEGEAVQVLNDIQSRKEHRLVELFRTLQLMDKKPELQLVKHQAEQILPFIRQIVDRGEMSDDDQKKIFDFLTPEQHAFIKDTNNRLKRRLDDGSDGGKPFEKPRELTDAERKAMLDEIRNRRGELPNGKPPREDNWLNEKSIEQQMIDLLEGKIK
jgi:hypothetical protein